MPFFAGKRVVGANIYAAHRYQSNKIRKNPLQWFYAEGDLGLLFFYGDTLNFISLKVGILLWVT